MIYEKISIAALTLFSLPVYASSLGYIQYWETNVGKIGRWNSTPIVHIKSISANTFQESSLKSYINHARNQWSSAGISTSYSEGSTGDISFRGCNWLQCRTLIDIPANAQGFADIQDQIEVDWQHLTGPKPGYSIDNVEVYIVYISGGVCEPLSTRYYS